MKINKIALITDTHDGFSKQTAEILNDFYQNLSKQDFDVLIHCGDWISHNQRQMKNAFKRIRRYIDKPICCVFGNHDYWHPQDDSTHKWSFVFQNHKALTKKYNITYLQDTNFNSDNLIITGLDGWYNNVNHPTNDKFWLPKFYQGDTIDTYFFRRAQKRLRYILNLENKEKKIIGVSHFGPHYKFGCSDKWEDFLTSKCDIVCYGHSHKERECKKNDCYIYNSGSDYNKPQYKIINIGD